MSSNEGGYGPRGSGGRAAGDGRGARYGRASRREGGGAGGRHALRGAAAGLCAAMATALPAAAQPPVSESEYLRELPVVLAASRLPQSLRDAAGSVSVIDREMIQASGAREISELFRLVPGFQVGYVTGANPVVTYHGLSGQFSRRMQVLVDGRSVYSAAYLGGVDWNAIPVVLDDIERIEVFRGSNSAAFGANAFLGVANIITRSPEATRGWRASLTGGNDGISDNMLSYGASSGEAGLRATVARRRDTGFDDIADTRHVSLFNLRADWRPGVRDEFNLRFGATDNSQGVTYTSALFPELTRGSATYSLHLGWNRTLGPDERIGVTFYRNQDAVSENAAAVLRLPPPLPTLRVPLEFGRNSTTDHLGLQHDLRLGATTRLAWGAEARVDRVRSRPAFGTDAEQTTSLRRLFASLEWRAAPTVVVNAGGLVEKYSLTGTHTAPRLAVSWQPTPEHTVRAGASRAYRVPTVYEARGSLIYAADTGQVIDIRFVPPAENSLRPERVTAREIGYLGEFRNVGLSVDVRLFHEHVRDLIVGTLQPLPAGSELITPLRRFLEPDSVVRDETLVFANVEEAWMRGAEYQVRWRPRPETLVLLGQTLIRMTASSSDTSRSAPSNNTFVLLSHRFASGLQLSAAHYWFGAVEWLEEASYLPGYRRLDVRAAWPVRFGPVRAEAAVVVQNALGSHAEYISAWRFGTRAFATLAVAF